MGALKVSRNVRFVKRVGGRGIYKNKELRHIGIAIDVELLEEINDLAEKNDLCFSEQCRTLLQLGLLDEKGN